MKSEKVRGMKDFYPEDERVQKYIFSAWRKIAEKYGYSEVDFPILENVDIYKKSGEEVPEQMYILKDKKGRKLALRPETTPTIARMLGFRKDLSKPVKWYSVSRCLRYERMQKGRGREFFQYNVDCLGLDNMLADAEVITVGVKVMQELGLGRKDFCVKINNRKIIQNFLERLGVKKIDEVLRLIDKKEKIGAAEFRSGLKKLCKIDVVELENFLKIKNLRDLDDYDLKGIDELRELFDYLKNFSVDGFCEIDFSITRGFDYYTGTVFEIFDKSKEFRSVAGGGRYDDLARGFPGVGFGMGDSVLKLVLEDKKKIPDLKKEVDYFVAVTEKELVGKAIDISEKLRKENNVEIDLSFRSLSKQLKYADEINAKKTVIVGPKELKKKKVVVRDMFSGREKKVKSSKLK